MRDIAVNVGVLPGSLYAHIKSKEELLLEIVSSGIESFLQIEVAARAMSGTAEEKLRYAVGRHIEVVAEDPAKMLIVFHQWRYLTPPNLSRAKKMRRRYAQFYRDLLKEGIAAGEFSSELVSSWRGLFAGRNRREDRRHNDFRPSHPLRTFCQPVLPAATAIQT